MTLCRAANCYTLGIEMTLFSPRDLKVKTNNKDMPVCFFMGEIIFYFEFSGTFSELERDISTHKGWIFRAKYSLSGIF